MATALQLFHPTLPDLAESINGYHAEAIAKAGEAVDFARMAGEALMQAKGRLSHGEWIPWLESNCTVDASQAQRYMKIAREWEKIEQKRSSAPYLSIRGALRELSDKPHVANNSGNNEWYTPTPIIDAVRAVMGGIDLDPASSDAAQGTVGAIEYFTVEDDGLSQPWRGRVFLNPPYKQPWATQFVTKLIEHVKAGDVTETICLTNNFTETEAGQLLLDAQCVCFHKTRISFIDERGEPSGEPLQGQMISYFGDRVAEFRKRFLAFGKVLTGATKKAARGTTP